MSFVKTPIGVIMHVDNHKAALELAKAHKLKVWIRMLEPAEPIEWIPDGTSYRVKSGT